MIRQSFVFLDKISAKSECNIRKQGIKDWNDFLEAESIKGISSKRKSYYNNRIMHAKKALHEDDLGFFNKHLPSVEMWRLYDSYKDECVFIDIEINRRDNDVTVVCLYDGYETMMFVKGINLDKKEIKDILSRYKMIVTYNGASFDIPNLRKYFNLYFPQIHIDLKPLCIKIGLKGGLKEIEKQLNISRVTDYEIKAGDPCKLYRLWRAKGDEHFLNLLIQYNEEDTVNLKPIAEYVIEKLKQTMLF